MHIKKQLKRHFYEAILIVSLCSVMPSFVFGQSTGGWVLDAPPNSVQLTSVGQGMVANGVKFTFTNISGKTIIEFRVDTRHGEMIGLDAFTNGKGAIAPGATLFVEFGTQALSFANEEPKILYVAAIAYADGSEAGSPKTLALVENEMLGAALETKRISGLLLNSPDPSMAGFDNVLSEIGSQVPQTDNDAAAPLKGIALPGVSQTYIDEHLTNPSFGLKGGVHRARRSVLLDIKNLKDLDAREIAGSRTVQLRALQNRPHALSDLAKEYSSLSDWQTQCIKGLSENAHKQ